MKKATKVIGGIVLSIGVLTFGGCAITLWGANEVVKEVDKEIEKMEETTASQDKLLQGMLDAAPEPVITKDEFSYTVEYTLTNDTGEDFDYIQVDYDVFDANGVKLGNSFTNITDVKNGQIFKVTLDLYQEGADRYEITGISSTVN